MAGFSISRNETIIHRTNQVENPDKETGVGARGRFFGEEKRMGASG
jgi:hypothetical protein